MATRVILMRHARAVEGNYPGLEDLKRPLTEEGKETQKMMAEYLQKKGYRVDTIFCSPYMRARESALAMSDVLRAPFQWDLCLNDPIDEKALLAKLPQPEEGRDVVLIGHDPSIPNLVNFLLGEKKMAGGMEKSGAVILSLDELKEGGAEFVQSIKPHEAKEELG